jgi:hypothetical protein
MRFWKLIKNKNERQRARYKQDKKWRSAIAKRRATPEYKKRKNLTEKLRRKNDPAHRARIRKYHRDYYRDNHPVLRLKRNSYYKRNRRRILNWQRDRRKAFPDIYRAIGRRHNLKLRSQILDAYGRKCSCCGEVEEKFLTLEHDGGGGTAHRRQVPSVHADLRRKGFPKKIYTLLCYNCNLGTKGGKKCPPCHLKRVGKCSGSC